MPPLEELPIHREMDPAQLEGDPGKAAYNK
jgi:hypothetical protein